MFAAVPATMFIAESIVVQFKSGNLIFAISSSWSRVMRPTVCFCGSAAPLGTPAAFFNNTEAGGVFKMNVKDLSSKTVISTGIIIPGWSAVRALYSLQNIIMLTPFAPSAGPIGGAGFALPASIASLMYPATFAAMTTGRRAPACARTSRRATAFAMNALVVCTRAVHPSVSALLARSEDVVHARVFVAARGAGVAPMGVAVRIAVVNIVDVR
mmetsp:Transcript_4047/g.8775  ORF Transcript_4047/g.8775 Transcript_4047/m.8775 type:complete len:213 (+) Transcript_4047:235-873(+)